jgi:hypothetical protein
MGLHFFTESDIIRVLEGLCLHHSFCNALPHTILICTFSTFHCLPSERQEPAIHTLLVGTASQDGLDFHYLPSDHQEPVNRHICW